MELSTKIINSLFDKTQIEALQTVYDECKHQYLNSIDLDPCCYDFTDDEVKKDIKTYLSVNLGHEVQNFDVDNLYRIIQCEFI